MSRPVTLSSLMTQARQRANMVNSTFVADTGELDQYVIQSWAALYDMLVQSDDDFFTTSVTFALTPGTPTYNVNTAAADFYKLRGVEVPISGDFKYTLDWIPFGERNVYNYPLPPYSTGYPRCFHLVGNNLTLYPTPSQNVTCTMWYVPRPPPLGTSTSTALDGYAGWEEWVVIDAAIKCLVKEENNETVALLESQKAAVTARILTMHTRDVVGPARVTRTRYRNRVWPFYRGAM